MAIDSYFAIGSAHASAGDPCQDYAFHGASWGVIADGCSSAPGRSDLGARIAASALSLRISSGNVDSAVLQNAVLDGFCAAMASGLAIRDDLLTTVGGFCVEPDGIQAWLWGDGVLYAEYSDGSTDLRVVESADNTPIYPIYWLDRSLPDLARTVNGVLVEGNLPFHWNLRNGEDRRIRNFVLATDGLTQVSGMGVRDVLVEMTAFKTVTGAFLKRRALRALKKMVPVDDIGMVAYHEDIC